MARRGRGMMRGMAGDAGWAVKPGEANGAAAQSIPGKRQTGRAEPRRRTVECDPFGVGLAASPRAVTRQDGWVSTSARPLGAS